MKKKFVAIVVLTTFTLVSISFATTVSSNTNIQKKESPLYKIRSKSAIWERDNVVFSKFFNGRLIFVPTSLLRILRNIDDTEQNNDNVGDNTRSFFHWITLFCKE